MTETIREQEYEARDGERVIVSLERLKHKSALQLRARHYSSDDQRMAYARFVVPNEDSTTARYQGDDDATGPIVAAVHDFGYEIDGIEDTILYPRNADLDLIECSLDASTFFEVVSRTTTSEFISIWARSLSNLSELLALNLFHEVSMILDGESIDEAMIGVNDQLLERKLDGPESFEEIISGIFMNEVYQENEWDESADVLEDIREVYKHAERETFLVDREVGTCTECGTHDVELWTANDGQFGDVISVCEGCLSEEYLSAVRQ